MENKPKIGKTEPGSARTQNRGRYGRRPHVLSPLVACPFTQTVKRSAELHNYSFQPISSVFSEKSYVHCPLHFFLFSGTFRTFTSSATRFQKEGGQDRQLQNFTNRISSTSMTQLYMTSDTVLLEYF